MGTLHFDNDANVAGQLDTLATFCLENFPIEDWEKLLSESFLEVVASISN